MKSIKVSITSILLSFFTLGSVYTQTAPKLAFSVNSGISRSGLPALVGLRAGLGDHISLNGHIGLSPWRRKLEKSRVIKQNVTLKEVEVRGGFTFEFDARAYTNPNQSGIFAGVGFMHQNLEIMTLTELNTEKPRFNFAGGANTVGGFLLGSLFDAILNAGGPLEIRENSTAKVKALTVALGYAHVFENNHRLEFGARFINRNLNDLKYKVPTFDAPQFYDVDTFANPLELTMEVRYVKTIL